MSARNPEPPDDTGSGSTAFASTLRNALLSRGIPLRRLQQRLRDRGYEVSVSTISMWQSGARRPERDTSLDVIRELEAILLLDDGQLADTLGPSRRVGPDRHESFASLQELEANPFTEEPAAELFERSGSVGVHVDAESKVRRVVNRTLWQARRDGARDAVIFFGLNPSEPVPPDVRGLLGCELIDVSADLDQDLVRATLRLHSPLKQGELAITERESTGHVPTEPEYEFTLVAPRRQAEVLLHVHFDPAHLPHRCRVLVESASGTTTHAVMLNGDCATHAEFNFGPGQVTMEWEW